MIKINKHTTLQRVQIKRKLHLILTVDNVGEVAINLEDNMVRHIVILHDQIPYVSESYPHYLSYYSVIAILKHLHNIHQYVLTVNDNYYRFIALPHHLGSFWLERQNKYRYEY